MGQYRFSAYAKWQIGLLLEVNKREIILHIPFATIHIAITKDAFGNNIFGK